MKKISLSRKELYNQIWSQGLQKTAACLIVNPSSLKKCCTEFNIPTPPSGYFSKLRHNKFEPKPVLMGDFQKQITLSIYRKKSSKKNQETAKLIKPHLLVLEAKKALKDVKEKSINMGAPRMLNIGGEKLSISVSKHMTEPALIFYNLLIKELESRKHLMVTKEYYGLVIKIDESYFEFSLREKTRRQKNDEEKWITYDYIPNGELVFKILSYPRKEWTSSKSISLLQKIPAIITYLEKEAEEERQWEIENEQRKQREEEAKLEKERIERIMSDEMEKFKRLCVASDRYHQAKNLGEFLKALGDKKGMMIDKNYMQWALAKVDWVDPLKDNHDPILGKHEDYLDTL
ncbi:hypothetical protein [Allomuricauda sp. NBRC 101325]|uniref:hypothetical protein n=1 Tax=Allomuricauda sp. NBRC 101325 TaxID=1113758 RepID=UPI0024A34891|nr:hypothetical protein [Muricauda sp. NBRC 101325]GLU43287.1 hypothetical protein Musp01_09110 [Muricauda sp. NBRC 101325]